MRAALCLALAACAAPLRDRGAALDPVKVDEVRVAFDSEDRARFGLALDIDNGEGAAASLTALDWEVWIEGRWFAAGKQQLSGELPPGHRALAVELPVVFQRMTVRSGTVSLEVGVRGAVEAEVRGSAVRLPFQRTLTVASRGAPEFKSPDEE